jgi:hypothetical protein
MADELDGYDCPICDEPLTDDVAWINPLAYRGSRPEDQAIDLGAAIGTAVSGGGYAPYHRKCAADRWPELRLTD